MRNFVTGAVLVFGLVLAVPAHAAPGQCTMTGFDDFACEVNVDGGGITFDLPSGETFVFAHVANGEGLGYLISAEPQPGARPEELGSFVPMNGQDGCWFGEEDEITFCAALVQ
jgi:hypothetical protein